MTLKLKSDKAVWYQLHSNHMIYDTLAGDVVKYHRHSSESIDEFKDRMIRLLVIASEGRKL